MSHVILPLPQSPHVPLIERTQVSPTQPNQRHTPAAPESARGFELQPARRNQNGWPEEKTEKNPLKHLQNV